MRLFENFKYLRNSQPKLNLKWKVRITAEVTVVLYDLSTSCLPRQRTISVVGLR